MEQWQGVVWQAVLRSRTNRLIHLNDVAQSCFQAMYVQVAPSSYGKFRVWESILNSVLFSATALCAVKLFGSEYMWSIIHRTLGRRIGTSVCVCVCVCACCVCARSAERGLLRVFAYHLAGVRAAQSGKARFRLAGARAALRASCQRQRTPAQKHTLGTAAYMIRARAQHSAHACQMRSTPLERVHSIPYNTVGLYGGPD